jgi:hypothetical protein
MEHQGKKESHINNHDKEHGNEFISMPFTESEVYRVPEELKSDKCEKYRPGRGEYDRIPSAGSAAQLSE